MIIKTPLKQLDTVVILIYKLLCILSSSGTNTVCSQCESPCECK